MSRPISRHTAAVAEPVKMFQHQTGKSHEGPFGEWKHSPYVSVRKEGSKLKLTGGPGWEPLWRVPWRTSDPGNS